MKSALMAAAAMSIAAVAAASAWAQAGPATGGTAEYWVSAETTSGLSAMAGMQGGRPNIGALLSGRTNRGPSYNHGLTLQLASPRRAPGTPAAEHLPPAGLGAGPSLPLITPQSAPTRPATPQSMNYGNARGRMLIYWGCGEHARGGPVEIDFARLTAGQVPPAMAALNVRPMTPPMPGTSGTYGDWPNQRSRTTVPATGSLVGEHVVRGNYSPEIRFALGQGQDFLPPVVLTSNTASASGAVPVAWRPVTNALGYFLMATGAREDGTIVMWTSSEVQGAQIGLDYLAPAEVARLIQQRAVLSPQTTQCTVPVELAGGVQGATLMLNAFGPEANFSHPVRPARPPRGWRPEWEVKVRTRSTYAGMLGMDMEAMMRGQEQPQPEQRRRRRNPLGGILGQ